MKTIALLLIGLFGFTTNSFSSNRTDISENCCITSDNAVKAQMEQLALDQLQLESEALPVDNVAGTNHHQLHKAVTRKLQEKSMADNIQEETEMLVGNVPVAFSPFSFSIQSETSDDGMLEKLQRETESISMTKPLFFLASKLESLARGKSSHQPANAGRK